MSHLGYTSRMHEIQAAVLARQVRQELAAWNARRSEIAAIYLDGMKGCGDRS